MSIEGNASNSRAPEERNVYSRAYLPQILKPLRGDMSIEGNASNSRAPEERNVYSRAYLPKPSKAPAGRHVSHRIEERYIKKITTHSSAFLCASILP